LNWDISLPDTATFFQVAIIFYFIINMLIF